MEGFSERFKAFQDEVAETQGELAKALGFTQSKVSAYSTGTNLPKVDAVSRVLEVYPQLNVRWLLTGEGEMFDPVTSPDAPRPEPGTMIPVVGEIQAGAMVARYVAEHPESYLPEPPGLRTRGDQIFGLRVRGRSMEPWMYDGDVAICSSFRKATEGDDVVYYQYETGESSVKRLDRFSLKSKLARLQPLNVLEESFTVKLGPGDQLCPVLAIWREMAVVRPRRPHDF